MSNGDIATKKSQYRMAAFATISFLAAIVIIWQWVITVRELDALAAGGGNLNFLLPQELNDLEKSPTSTPSKQKTQKQNL